MHKNRTGGLIIDCQAEDLDVAEAFWTQALGYEALRSTDPDGNRLSFGEQL